MFVRRPGGLVLVLCRGVVLCCGLPGWVWCGDIVRLEVRGQGLEASGVSGSGRGSGLACVAVCLGCDPWRVSLLAVRCVCGVCVCVCAQLALFSGLLVCGAVRGDVCGCRGSGVGGLVVLGRPGSLVRCRPAGFGVGPPCFVPRGWGVCALPFARASPFPLGVVSPFPLAFTLSVTFPGWCGGGSGWRGALASHACWWCLLSHR